MSAPRVAIAGMILESNRFAKPAGQADFESLTWVKGDALLAAARESTPAIAAECAAFVRAMDATGPWAPKPLLLAASHPAGPVERNVLEHAISTMETRLREAGPVDAVYVCNHGAMVAEHLDDPDGEIFARLRAAAGPEAVVVATLDLHANISRTMVEAADLIVGYRTNPHVDMIERGEEAAFSLRRILSNDRRPYTALCRPPIVPASVTLLTADGPYGDLIDYGQRRQAEMAGAILNVSVFGNFVFSDVPENGLSVVVTARDDREAAETLAREIAQRAWNNRTRFTRKLKSVDEAVAMATNTEGNSVLFSDAGDNPGGGGSGRTTELLSALIAADAPNVLYGSFFDPKLVAEAHAAGAGALIDARFNSDQGTDAWEQWDTPVTTQARVLALGDGNVTGERGIFGGRRLTLGPTAALEIGGITVVVISDRAQTADPVFFHMLGLDIAAARTVVVKSRGHFRAGFDRWFTPEQIHEIDTMGLTSPVLERWPFERLPRPSYPLDPDTEWTA